MKVTGETLSFHHERKGAEGARYQKYSNFQAKGLLPGSTILRNCYCGNKTSQHDHEKAAAVPIGEYSIEVSCKWLRKKRNGKQKERKRKEEKKNEFKQKVRLYNI